MSPNEPITEGVLPESDTDWENVWIDLGGEG
jgi:hypothetical protein